MLLHPKITAALVVAAATTLLAASSLRELPASPAPEPTLEPTRAMHGRVLHESDALAVPTGLEVAGDRLVLADDFAEHSLRILRRSDGSLERSFGHKGRGPREFESVFAIDVIDEDRLMVHDATLQRVTWIDLDRDFEGDRWVSDRSAKLNVGTMLLATAWKPDGLLGIGAIPDGRLAHLTPDGRLLRTTGNPPVSPGTVTPRVWTRAYQSRLEPHPDRRLWAVAARFADRLDIYDGDGAHVASGDRPYGFAPEDARVDDPEAVRFGYIDLAATRTRIYALFSGRTRAQGQANLGDRLHVFDWAGRLLEVRELDSRLIALAVSPDGSRLYGVRHEPRPAVMAYALD